MFSWVLAQKNMIYGFKFEFWNLKENLEVPEFVPSTRVTELVLKRPLCDLHLCSSDQKLARAWNACSQKFTCFVDHSSDKSCARARTWVSRSSDRRAWKSYDQYFLLSYRPLKRRKLHSREGSCIRARPLFSASIVKCVQVHFSILIAS